ncbi:hypothetical protein A3715_05535 [Oleiphilus sp. HI0009]|nr:hypothetical protein A3715_05535 [Oleiphilus sp. HI0009]
MPSISLTPEQRIIVDAPVAHYVIRAVAGSGKTTTLAHRINKLLADGYDPRRLLVLMFNKSAQLDFQKKLQSVRGEGQSIPEVRTFHAMGFRLYKRFIELGVLAPYQGNILSEREIQFHLLQLVPQVLSPEQQNEFKRYKKEYLDVAASFIDQCKSQLDDPHSFFKHSGLENKFGFLPSLFERFEQWRNDHSRISYADMLYTPVKTIIAKPELRDLVSNKMDVILVDEYQDTNDIQHTLLSLIAGERAKVTIVGDPDQTIYEFRGAKPQYMLSGFAEEYTHCESLKLSTSFRYGHQVALLANQLIAHSPYHDDALCIPAKSNPHTAVELCETQNELISLVTRLAKHDASQRNQTAILVRYWSQTANLELALLRANLPYVLNGFRGIFGSDEMYAIRSLLQLADGSFAQMPPTMREQAFIQLARFPHVGINERQIQLFMHQLAQHSSRWGHHVLNMIPSDLSRFQKLKLERFAKGLSALENNTNPPRQLFKQYIQETKLFDELKTSGLSQDASDEQVRTVKNLMAFMAESRTENANALLNELAALEERTQIQHAQGIHITSMHRAKGLEWEHVVLPGLSETTFFSSSGRKEISPQDIASERRLIYVAMTRAKQSLLMLCPKSDSKDGLRFLHEMQSESALHIARSIERQQNTAQLKTLASKTLQRYADTFSIMLTTPSKAERPTLSNFDQAIWQADIIEHKSMGRGRVVQEEGETFTVQFDDNERRVFSKRYADKMFALAD